MHPTSTPAAANTKAQDNVLGQAKQLSGQDRRYLLCGSFKERAASISAEVLNRASFKGEVNVAIARLIFCSLLWFREIFILLKSNDHSPKRLGLIAIAFCGMSISIVLLTTQKVFRRIDTNWLLFCSVLSDSLLFWAACALLIYYPLPGSQGFLTLPYCVIFYLIIIATGLRISRQVVATTVVVNLMAFLGLLLMEQLVLVTPPQYSIGTITFFVIVLLSSGLLALMIANRTIRLVTRSAQAVIEAERVRDRLGSYVGREVAEAALSEKDFHLGGVRQPCAVLFSSLWGFAKYSEQLAPEELVLQLNSYLEDMVRAVSIHGGVVDKFLGDGLMVVFGVPQMKGDEAARALRAAMDMQTALDVHNQHRARRGLAPLQHGIGIHYGSVIAGNVGVMEHAQYTVVGDVVNVASRLQKATKDLGMPILYSEEIRQATSSFVPAESDLRHFQLTLRGRKALVSAFGFSRPSVVDEP